MRVIRTAGVGEFVQIKNTAVRDYRLSWRARGLLAELLSYPDGWETTVDKLVELARRTGEATEGYRAMRTAMSELAHAGYVRYVRRSGPGGRWKTEIEVSDTPADVAVSDTSVTDTSADRTSDVRHVGDRPGSTSNTDANTDTNTDLLKTADQYSESLASLAVVVGTTTREEMIQLELKWLYNKIDEMSEADRRTHLLALERKRKRIYRECRNEALRQIVRDEPRTLKTDRAVPVTDRLSYKYAALHYAHSPTGVPAWFRRPLEGLS